MIRRYHMLPDIPDAGLLDRYLDTLGVIVPLARTNLVTNPSFETNTTGWTAIGGGTGLTRSPDYGCHGAYSLFVNHDATGNQGTYYAISLTSGTSYVFSVKLYDLSGTTPFSQSGNNYKISIANASQVDQAAYTFTSIGGHWRWVWVFFTPSSTTTYRLTAVRTDTRAGTFLIDGAQLEALSDGYNVPTTYLDGDQLGLVANQFPIVYGWNGTPHASTSYRTAQTRAGGRIVRLKDLGFFLTAIIGLGMAPPQHQALTFAQLDGGQYQDTIKPPRQFSLAGRVAAVTPNSNDTAQAQLSRLFDRDMVAQRQPLVLTMQAQNCGEDCGDRVMIPVLYSGGLEGNVLELPTAQLPITFTQYIPYVQGLGQSNGLTVQTSTVSVNRIYRRAPNGAWGTLGTGASGGDVYAVARGLNGLIYLGGDFTSFNGVSNTARICSYDPVTGTVAALGTGSASGHVIDLQIAPNGDLYAVGTFANMGGVAAADFVAIWNGSAWSAPGTPPTVSSTGPGFPAGGAFDNQGRFFLAPATTSFYRWNGSAWTTIATGTVQNTAVVRAPDGNMIIGTNGAGTIGGATNAVVKYNVTSGAFSAYGGTQAQLIASMVFDNAGRLYVVGGNAALERTNGIAWSTLIQTSSGSGIGTYDVTFNPRSALIYVSGDFTAVQSISAIDSFFAYNGAAALVPDVDLPGTIGTTILPTARAFNDGSLIVSFTASGTATSAGITTVTNNGTAAVYPTLTLTGPTSGTARIASLANTTTGAAIYFNYTIQAGETAVLTLDPTNISFVSSFSGNILPTILPGSNLTTFSLQPGVNTISFFATSSTVTATLQSPIGYNNLNDALYQAVAP